MKIVNDKKPEKKIDLDSLIEEAFQKYDAVFFSDIVLLEEKNIKIYLQIKILMIMKNKILYVKLFWYIQ